MTRLNHKQQIAVVAALVKEYRWLGVTAKAAAIQVKQGKWDDHPAASLLEDDADSA